MNCQTDIHKWIDNNSAFTLLVVATTIVYVFFGYLSFNTNDTLTQKYSFIVSICTMVFVIYIIYLYKPYSTCKIVIKDGKNIPTMSSVGILLIYEIFFVIMMHSYMYYVGEINIFGNN